MTLRLHITGASGSGTSTLGRALAGRLDIRPFDTDDFYWLPGAQPYTEKRSPQERVDLLRAAFAQAGGWVLSGSVGAWAAPLVPQFDLVIFLWVPTEVRLARLRARERERYGRRIEPGGDRHQAYRAFLEWAATYEAGPLEGRSRSRHEGWLSTLSCPVLRLEGSRPLESQIADCLDALTAHGLVIRPG
jgi:adenylate kinase family enzyme